MMMTLIWVPLDVIHLPISKLVVEIISSASKFYATTALFLYCFTSWMAWKKLNELTNDLEAKEQNLPSFKLRYDRVCLWIDGINRYLGCAMFLFISYTMISAILVCFGTVVQLRHSESPWPFLRNGSLLAQHALNLTMITYIPYFIKNQVFKLLPIFNIFLHFN